MKFWGSRAPQFNLQGQLLTTSKHRSVGNKKTEVSPKSPWQTGLLCSTSLNTGLERSSGLRSIMSRPHFLQSRNSHLNHESPLPTPKHKQLVKAGGQGPQLCSHRPKRLLLCGLESQHPSGLLSCHKTTRQKINVPPLPKSLLLFQSHRGKGHKLQFQQPKSFGPASFLTGPFLSRWPHTFLAGPASFLSGP